MKKNYIDSPVLVARRRANLKLLLRAIANQYPDYGPVNRLAAAMNYFRPNGSPNGGPVSSWNTGSRPISSDMCRQIENAAGLPQFWMETDHGVDPPLPKVKLRIKVNAAPAKSTGNLAPGSRDALMLVLTVSKEIGVDLPASKYALLAQEVADTNPDRARLERLIRMAA